MKYTIEYVEVTKIEKMCGIPNDYAISVADLKEILKNAKHPVKCIIKNYKDGAGVDVTEKYVKTVCLCDTICR